MISCARAALPRRRPSYLLGSGGRTLPHWGLSAAPHMTFRERAEAEMTPHAPQEHHHPSTSAPEPARTGPISPAARTYADEHGDVSDWNTEWFEIYAELGGIQ